MPFKKTTDTKVVDGEIVLQGVRQSLSVRDLLLWPLGLGVTVVFGIFINLCVISVLQGGSSDVGGFFSIGVAWIFWLLIAIGEAKGAMRLFLLIFAKRHIRIGPHTLADEMIIWGRVWACRSYEVARIKNAQMSSLHEYRLRQGIRDYTKSTKHPVVVFEYNGEGEQCVGECLCDADVMLLMQYVGEDG